jgi:hypothetical protein
MLVKRPQPAWRALLGHITRWGGTKASSLKANEQLVPSFNRYRPLPSVGSATIRCMAECSLRHHAATCSGKALAVECAPD